MEFYIFIITQIVYLDTGITMTLPHIVTGRCCCQDVKMQMVIMKSLSIYVTQAESGFFLAIAA